MADDVVITTQVGPQSPMAAGTNVRTHRSGRTGEWTVGDAHARYFEAVSRGNVFMASTQTALAIGTALTATGVTFHLCNPIGSVVDLVVLQASLSVPAITTAGNIVFAANPVHSTAVTAGTALVVQAANLSGASGVGLAKSATTLPAVPVAVRPLATVHTAAGILQIIDYVDGALIVSP